MFGDVTHTGKAGARSLRRQVLPRLYVLP
jgi:hypothetical protein